MGSCCKYTEEIHTWTAERGSFQVSTLNLYHFFPSAFLFGLHSRNLISKHSSRHFLSCCRVWFIRQLISSYIFYSNSTPKVKKNTITLDKCTWKRNTKKSLETKHKKNESSLLTIITYSSHGTQHDEEFLEEGYVSVIWTKRHCGTPLTHTYIYSEIRGYIPQKYFVTGENIFEHTSSPRLEKCMLTSYRVYFSVATYVWS